MHSSLREAIQQHGRPGWRVLTRSSATECRVSVDLGTGPVLRIRAPTATQAEVSAAVKIVRRAERHHGIDPVDPGDDEAEPLVELLEASIVQAQQAKTRLRLIKGGKS